ncbi:type VI secretion system protein IglI family protein [Dongshaea marina]|uniref:type VI secretion system protein IglI family protein n=1 Tax=Dongshaea marina TaxID=2047966 RepID=UPI00131EF03C|nr:type VI secretion system protein IglI family protein [Dongshaea marina]
MFDFIDDIFHELRVLEKVNPMRMSQIIHYYQEGEYSKALTAIKDYSTETHSVDIYLIFMGFSCDLFLNLNKVELLNEMLNSYLKCLTSLNDKLSPSRDFSRAIKQGIITLLSMIELKISDLMRSCSFFEYSDLAHSFSQLFEYSASLSEPAVEYISSSQYISATKSLKSLSDWLVKLSDKEKSEVSSDKVPEFNSENQKISNKKSVKNNNYIDNFASNKWYHLIKKVAMFQATLKDDRLFESSIIYNDIQSELTVFDPKEYFPGLFFPLFKSLAPHAKSIYRHIEQHSNTLEWHIASNLYRSDPNRFLRDLPKMVENNYSSDAFHEGDYINDAYRDERKLIDESVSLIDNEQYSFKEDISMDEGSEQISQLATSSEHEFNDLLSDIDDIWDSSDINS